MLREEFDQLVRRIEKRYEARPDALKWKVISYALVGYFGILAWMAFIIPSILVCFYAIWLGAPPVGTLGIASLFAALGWLIIRRIKLNSIGNEGIELKPDRFPDFFQQLNQMSDQLGSYRFDRVWILDSCNAGVHETGNLILGKSKKHLTIGLPMMEVLSQEELFAVLAHEVAHLSARHARLKGWIYRLRINWQTVHNGKNTATQKVWRWFWPVFNAHAFVLSRFHEYEADRVAAQCFGAEASLSALVRTNIGSHLESRFWEQFWNRTQTEANPPDTTFQELSQFLKNPLDAEELNRWVEELLNAETDNTDTHPSFRYRAAALAPEFDPLRVTFPLNQPNSAEAILKDELPAIREALQKNWANKSAENWGNRHRRNQALSELLKGTEFAGDMEQMDAALAFERAEVMAKMYGLSSAEPLLRWSLYKRPNHPRANYLLGCLLLENGDASGESYLQHCMDLDEDYTVACSQALLQSAIRLGRRERIQQLRQALDEYEKNQAKAREESLLVKWSDSFTEHDLPGEVLTQLHLIAADRPAIQKIRLGRKVMRHSRKKLFVVAVSLSFGASGKVISDLVYQLSLPGSFLVVSSAAERIIWFKLGRIPGSLVYSRN